MADGAVLLRGFVKPYESELIAGLREIVAQAPFRRMFTPGGHQMSVAMTNCGHAGWVTDHSGYRYDGIDPVYNAGNIVSQYRHRQDQGEVFGGWSPGLVDGWTRRYSLGLSVQDDTFALEPGRVAPAQLPPDEKLVAPFVRFELVEDRYERLQNRNLIARPEYTDTVKKLSGYLFDWLQQTGGMQIPLKRTIKHPSGDYRHPDNY